MTRKPPARPSAADTAEQLRELIREAHAAVKDLRAAIRDAHAVAQGAEDAVHDVISTAIVETAAHMQRESNRNAAELNAAVTAAREHIVKSLTMAVLIPNTDYTSFTVKFHGGGFDDNA